MTTLEDAKRCPRCEKSGRVGPPKNTLRPGTQVVVVTCETVGCPWEGTGWPVQINPDGSIPDAAPTGTVRGEKQFGTVNPLLDNQRIQAVEQQIRKYGG
jgi:hypothetical protein